MRITLAVTICAVAGCLSGAALAQENAPRETLLRWHFAGTKALLANEELRTYQEVAQMPETARLREEMFQTLALKAAARFAKGPEGPGAAERAGQTAKLIAPLIENFSVSESHLVLASPGEEQADWALAVRAAGDGAQLWSTNLWKLVESSRLGKPEANRAGWAVQTEKYRLLFSQEKDWVFFAGGHSDRRTHEAALLALKKDLSKKTEQLLSAEINLPAFARITRKPALNHAPRIALSSRARSGGIRTEMNLEYPHDLGIKAEKWDVPKDLIRDPLIAFTALQGIQERLGKREKFKSLEPEKIPNQLFVWSQSLTPFSISAAAKVGNPEEFIDNLAERAMEEKGPELKKMALGELRYNESMHNLIWSGLPIVVPFIRPAGESHPEHVVMGLFPIADPSTNAAPAALFDQLQEENLVYYAWEITGARIAQWRPLWQMSRFLRNHPIASSTSASEQWLPAVAPKLDNTITEGTLTGPRSLKLVRQSELGFSALELVLIAHLADRYDQPATTSPQQQPNGQRKAPPQRSSPPPLNQPSRQGSN